MFSSRQITGQRQRQEDSFNIEDVECAHQGESIAGQLIVVADGMGGHAGGDVASNLAVGTFCRSLKAGAYRGEAQLAAALIKANDRIAQEIACDAALTGMGTTLLGAIRSNDSLNWVSVGDSLLLLFRDGVLGRLNEDHSMLPRLIEIAEATGRGREEAYQDRRRHHLRSALTGTRPSLIDQANCELRRGDLLIFASDGIETLSMNDLAALLEQNRESTTDQLADLIIKTIEQRENPRQDNVTLIVYRHC